MKNFISIILIISILGSSTSVAEVFKLPILIRHYHQHEAQKKQFDCSNFLITHYLKGDNNNTSKDLMEHEKLPFKSRVNYNFQVQTILNEGISFYCDLKVSRQLFFIYDILDELCYLQKIWQPPV